MLATLVYRKLWFGMAYAMLIMVALASLLPAPDMEGNDKLLHFVTYFLISGFFTVLVQQHRSLWIIAMGLVLYGALLEIMQGLSGYRMMDSLDMLANSLGVMGGLLVRISPLPRWFRKMESAAIRRLG